MTKGCRHMGRGVFSVCVLCRADTPDLESVLSRGPGAWDLESGTQEAGQRISFVLLFFSSYLVLRKI